MANGTRPFATLKNTTGLWKILIVLPALVGQALDDKETHAEQKSYKNYYDQDLDRYCNEAYKRYKAFNQNN